MADEEAPVPSLCSVATSTSDLCVDSADSDNNGKISEENNKYSYLERDANSTEKFKIEIRGLPKFFGYKALKKLITTHSVTPHKLKLVIDDRSQQIGYVNFFNENDRDTAISKLDGATVKRNVIKVVAAKPKADPFFTIQKRKQIDEEKGSPSGADSPSEKRGRLDESPSLPDAEKLKEFVIPLWNMPYEEQLKVKKNHMAAFLRKFGRLMERSNKDLDMWLQFQKRDNNGLCCTLEDIKASPSIEGYRNKCEFTVGKSSEIEKAVGFRLGRYKDGTLSIASPSECIHLSEATKRVVQSFQDYLQISSLDVYDPRMQQGHYRMFTVRLSRLNDLMVIAQFHPQTLSEEEIEKEKTRLRDFFVDGPGKACCVTSLFMQRSIERATGGHCDSEFEHLHGDQHIHERIFDLTLRISPGAFFQVNTGAAEVLYGAIADWCDITPNTTVLDICCGTGAIGLALAKHAQNVIGVELCQQAVDDANHNAQSNGITNAKFMCGKAEDILPDIMQSIDVVEANELIAVVDPPRAGLYLSVIRSIRNCEQLKRLVYVSCNPSGALTNFVSLIQPVSKKLKGDPFKPSRALPVDLFPHTNHCELVVLFER